MKQREIISLVEKGILTTEWEYETALSADRSLRILAKTDPAKKKLRSQLRGLIAKYEQIHWADESKVTESRIAKSDQLEIFAEKERRFIEERKKSILNRLEKLQLNQNDLGKLLEHHKSYVSELLNGIRPFSLKDLILVHLLLKISFENLIFSSIPIATQKRIEGQVSMLDKVRLKKGDLALVRVE